MRTEKCGWKIANDTMHIIKSLWGKINLRCFLKVLLQEKKIHMFIFAGQGKWIQIVKNCDLGPENAAAEVTVFHYTDLPAGK